ncbi:glutamyl-tRNA reductase [Archaeoglobus neptunius]|uniref:glutamyl-tRNA reductase n=1 Tax=Archaeoglobus neptunius TaxID=2798580 RepID=UPI00192754CC|nr:glutamyl-tRNA reductase [Archaeoglobus neptunius]
MEIGCLTISHKKANVEDIEKLWLKVRTDLDSYISECGVSEYAYIFTCNRFELYLAGGDVESCLRGLVSRFDIAGKADILLGDECLLHLMRVAAGVESMIVGEEQILGQVRHYHNLCRKEGLTGEILDRVFSKAIQVGRKVRRETEISRGSVSIGSAAVDVAERILGTLKGKKALLVGAGEMGTLVARAIASKEVEAVLIANRTFERAEELARKIGGIAVKFDKLEEYLRICDVVISATSAPHKIIKKSDVEKAMKGRKSRLLIIDIALPRDVEEGVGDIDGVELLTIDDLRKVSEENLKKRLGEVEKAEQIIREELDQLKMLLKDMNAKAAIAAMYSLAEKYVGEEIEELYSRLSARYKLDDAAKEMLEDFASSLIRKFLREPTVRLREAARNEKSYIIEAVRYLFGDGNGRIPEAKAEKTEKIESKEDIPRSEVGS